MDDFIFTISYFDPLKDIIENWPLSPANKISFRSVKWIFWINLQLFSWYLIIISSRLSSFSSTLKNLILFSNETASTVTFYFLNIFSFLITVKAAILILSLNLWIFSIYDSLPLFIDFHKSKLFSYTT